MDSFLKYNFSFFLKLHMQKKKNLFKFDFSFFLGSKYYVTTFLNSIKNFKKLNYQFLKYTLMHRNNSGEYSQSDRRIWARFAWSSNSTKQIIILLNNMSSELSFLRLKNNN